MSGKTFFTFATGCFLNSYIHMDKNQIQHVQESWTSNLLGRNSEMVELSSAQLLWVLAAECGMNIW